MARTGFSFLERIKYERLNSLRENQKVIDSALKYFDLSPVQTCGYSFHLYPSGELTGAQYVTSHQSVFPPPARACGSVVTTGFTFSARAKIRRAAENAAVDLKYFCTLTFAPAFVPAEQLDGNGNVLHAYAKKELCRFLNTLSVTTKRRGNELHYIWTAELQKNGNIHYHIIWNTFFPIKWLTKIWGQANNSVDIETVNNSTHAVNYMRKYISKDDKSTINGNRYGISQNLRGTMKPTRVRREGPEAIQTAQEIIKAMRYDIEAIGGQVIDFGFRLPRSTRSQIYRDKQGRTQKTRGVSSEIHRSFQDLLAGEVPF